MPSDADEQDQRKAFQVETKGIEPIEATERHGRSWSVFTLWFGANVQFATLVTGALATAVFGLGFWAGAVAVALGTVLGSSLIGVLSTRGPRTGLAQLIQARGPFGYFGNLPAAVFVILNGVGWFAVNTVLGVFILRDLLHVPFALGLAIIVVIQVAIAIFGYSLIHVVERVLAVILAMVFTVVSVYGFDAADLNVADAPAMGTGGAFILTVAVTAARCLGYSMYASDYTRYLPVGTRPRNVFLAAAGGATVAGVWIGVLGAALGTFAQIGDPTSLVTGLLPRTLAVITLVAFVCSTLASTVIDLYSGAMAALVMGMPARRWVSALVVGILGTVLCWYAGRTGWAAHFQTFLQLTGYWIAPWAAVLVADFWWLNRGRRFELEPLYDPEHRGRGLLAVLVGLAVSVPFMHQDLFTGPVAAAYPGLGDIAYFVGFLVAGVTYRLIARRVTTEAPSRAHTEAVTQAPDVAN